MIIAESIVNHKGKQMKVVSYCTDGDKEKLQQEHAGTLANLDINVEKNIAMCRDIIENDLPGFTDEEKAIVKRQLDFLTKN